MIKLNLSFTSPGGESCDLNHITMILDVILIILHIINLIR